MFDATVPAADQTTVAQSARLDLLWPTMYINSNETKAVLAAVGLSASNRNALRYFPGNDLSGVPGSLFACENEQVPGCYDPEKRSWYEAAIAAELVDDIGMGEVIVVDPYIDAIGSQKNWLVTLARAVYADTGATNGQLLGVVGVDVRLDQVQLSVEGINFLDSGYSILAAAADGAVLAAPSRVWDRDSANDSTTVCKLGNGMCVPDDDDAWENLLSVTEEGAYGFMSVSSNEEYDGEYSILVAAPVTAVFDTETDEGRVTHYVLSAVPREEIFDTVDLMAELIKSSRNGILATTGFVALATLVAVAAAVWVLAGTITRPIVKMTSAASSIAKDGAKTNVFGGVAAAWGGGRDAGSSLNGAGGRGSRSSRAIDYVLCRGDDEISALVHEFSLMFTGLGRRGSAAVGTGLEDSSVYPQNPFTTNFQREPPSAPPAN